MIRGLSGQREVDAAPLLLPDFCGILLQNSTTADFEHHRDLEVLAPCVVENAHLSFDFSET